MKTFKVSYEDFRYVSDFYFYHKIFQIAIPLRIYKPLPAVEPLLEAHLESVLANRIEPRFRVLAIWSLFSFEKGEKSQGALSGELCLANPQHAVLDQKRLDKQRRKVWSVVLANSIAKATKDLQSGPHS